MTDNSSASFVASLLGVLRLWAYPDESTAWRADNAHWMGVLDLAEANKALLLAAEGMKRAGISIPPEQQERLRAIRETCAMRALANLGITATVCSILRTHGINAISLKGVLRAHRVYGRWDARPAQDTDLLVTSADYRSAIAVLAANGFHSPIPAKSIWWHDYLGESPHLPLGGGTTVDLHHKIRQPGTPAPTDIARIIANARTAAVGGRTVPAMSDMDAALLTATSLGKALRGGEVWLHYAHELFVVTARLDAKERAEYDAYAREMGIARLWDFATQLADDTFALPLAGADALSEPRYHRVIELLDAEQRERRGRRSTLLWKWTDGALMRPLRFTRELCFVRLGERRHDYEDP